MKTSVLILGALTAIVLTACPSRQREARKEPPDPPTPPVPLHVEASAVHFEGDQAVECLDVATEVEPSNGVILDRATIADGLFSLIKSKEVVRIQRPCAEQFAGRPCFARCALDPEVDGHATMHIQTCFLSLDYVANDSNMKDCLSMKGKWDELPRSSNQFQEARLRRDMEKAQHAAQSLQRLAGGGQ